jgi:hypothetical protein
MEFASDEMDYLNQVLFEGAKSKVKAWIMLINQNEWINFEGVLGFWGAMT